MFKEFLARTETNYNENLKKNDIDLSEHILDLNCDDLVETNIDKLSQLLIYQKILIF